MTCECWDCLRAAGRTPSQIDVPFRKGDEVGDRHQRTGTLFAGENAPRIPSEADVLGHDRPKKRALAPLSRPRA